MENFKKSITASGLRNAAFAVVTGFIIKVIFDYFCAKDLVLNLSKATVLISNENIIDSISFANQVGRLDLVSLILALLGIVIGFGAIFGFLHIKESSENVAKNVTEKWFEDNEGKIVKKVADIFMQMDAGLVSEKLSPLKEAKKEAKKDRESAKSDDKEYENV